jgi:CheY-like chemotaxis protein
VIEHDQSPGGHMVKAQFMEQRNLKNLSPLLNGLPTKRFSSGPKVLIINPGEANLKTLRFALRQKGCQVIEVNSKDRVFMLLERIHFQFIIIGWNDSGLKAWEILSDAQDYLKEKGRPWVFPVVSFSHKLQRKNSIRRLRYFQFVGHLQIPISYAALTFEVEKILSYLTNRTYLDLH